MNGLLLEAWVIQTWSWTLLHFLWQGFCVAGVAATGLVFLRGKSPSARYLWCVVCLLFMALCPVATFVLMQPQRHLPSIPQSDSAATPLDLTETGLLLQRYTFSGKALPTLGESLQVPHDTTSPVHAATADGCRCCYARSSTV
jgi:hypothetical protein